MKIKLLGTEMLAQCPDCQAIKMLTNNKYYPYVWKMSIATFPKLSKEQCLTCLEKATKK